jgi:cephalosporin-C deacetylase-like acetyl esterase
LTRWTIAKYKNFAYSVFRGTSLTLDAFQDIFADSQVNFHRLEQSRWYVYAGMFSTIHNGYEITEILEGLYNERMDTLYGTGHSLGGALAQMFVLEWTLRARGRVKQSDRWLQEIAIEAITFGSPQDVAVQDEDHPHKATDH